MGFFTRRREQPMGLITNILFPVNFSRSCIAMAKYVKRVADIFNARVSLIHVFDPASYNGLELYVRAPDEIALEHEELAQSQLDSFLQAEFPSSQYPRILASGDVATEIASNARNGFDLIIMPTHSGIFRRMLLGSTTAKVLNDVDCPVVTGEHAEGVAPRPIAHWELLCAIGPGESSESVLRYASELSAQARARLSIVHAIEAKDFTPPDQSGLDVQTRSAHLHEAHERIEALQRKVGSRAPVRIALGPVKKVLLEIARVSMADALIIGRGPQSENLGRMRDLTYALVRDSPYPVISV